MFNPKILFCTVLLFSLFSCQKPIETIEVRDDDGRLKERYHQRKKDAVKDGTFERFFVDGTVSERMFYKNDTLQGEHIYFYENGAKDVVQQHKNGKLDGMYQKFFKDGQLKLELPYVEDVLVGEGRGYYVNGQVKEVVRFENNEENGPFTEYHENGKLKTEGSYAFGDNEQDTLKMYNESGIIEKIMFCERGICKTLWKE